MSALPESPVFPHERHWKEAKNFLEYILLFSSSQLIILGQVLRDIESADQSQVMAVHKILIGRVQWISRTPTIMDIFRMRLTPCGSSERSSIGFFRLLLPTYTMIFHAISEPE